MHRRNNQHKISQQRYKGKGKAFPNASRAPGGTNHAHTGTTSQSLPLCRPKAPSLTTASHGGISQWSPENTKEQQHAHSHNHVIAPHVSDPFHTFSLSGTSLKTTADLSGLKTCQADASNGQRIQCCSVRIAGVCPSATEVSKSEDLRENACKRIIQICGAMILAIMAVACCCSLVFLAPVWLRGCRYCQKGLWPCTHYLKLCSFVVSSVSVVCPAPWRRWGRLYLFPYIFAAISCADVSCSISGDKDCRCHRYLDGIPAAEALTANGLSDYICNML